MKTSRRFLVETTIFRGYVSFRGSKCGTSEFPSGCWSAYLHLPVAPATLSPPNFRPRQQCGNAWLQRVCPLERSFKELCKPRVSLFFRAELLLKISTFFFLLYLGVFLSTWMMSLKPTAVFSTWEMLSRVMPIPKCYWNGTPPIKQHRTFTNRGLIPVLDLDWCLTKKP